MMFIGKAKKIEKSNVNPVAARKEVLKLAFAALNIPREEAQINFLLTQYAFYKEEAIYLFEQVLETLTTLKNMGKTLGLITNGGSERQREKLAWFDLASYFNIIWISDKQNLAKPDLRVYQALLTQCNLKAEEACMVSDHYLWEVEAPIKCGMKGVYLDFEAKGLPAKYKV